MARSKLRIATLFDLELLVRHRRGMWAEISDFTEDELDAADRAYRRWARTRLTSGRLVGFIVETTRGEPIASGCLWIMPVQPRPMWSRLTAPYLMSMYTEPAHRGKGHATRILQEAVRRARARGYDMVLLHASQFGRGICERGGFKRTREMRLVLRPREATKVPRRPRSKRRLSHSPRR